MHTILLNYLFAIVFNCFWLKHNKICVAKLVLRIKCKLDNDTTNCLIKQNFHCFKELYLISYLDKINCLEQTIPWHLSSKKWTILNFLPFIVLFGYDFGSFNFQICNTFIHHTVLFCCLKVNRKLQFTRISSTSAFQCLNHLTDIICRNSQ